MTIRRNKIIAAVGIAAAFLCVSFCAHDPVDEDYFMTLDRVRGGDKPAPAPVIKSIAQSGEYVVFDFSDTTTVDPDTGSAAGLYYLFYGSTSDPALFEDPLLYYDGLYYLGYIEHARLTTLVVTVLIGDYHGPAYFWMSAHDGGRESDHSNVIYIAL